MMSIYRSFCPIHVVFLLRTTTIAITILHTIEGKKKPPTPRSRGINQGMMGGPGHFPSMSANMGHYLVVLSDNDCS